MEANSIKFDLPTKSALLSVLFLWFLLLFCNLGFFFNCPIKAAYILWAIAAALPMVALQSTSARDLLCVVFLTLLVFCLSAAISAVAIDMAWDGWAYHEPATIYLANDWNPHDIAGLSQSVSRLNAEFGTALGEYLNTIWVEAYPKGAWEIAAVFLKSGLPIDVSKMSSFVISLVAVVLVFNYAIARGFRKRKSLFVAVLLVYSPVVISQLSTYYVDGLLGLMVVVMVFGFLNYTETRSTLYLIFVVFAATTIGTLKFTGLIYLVIMAGPILFFIYKFSAPRFFAGLVSFSSLALLIFLWSPYATNYLNHGYVFYPFNIINVMDGQMSDAFLSKGRFEKLFLSLTSGSGWDIKDPVFLGGYKLSDFRLFGAVQDVHLNGFGPLFIIVLGITAFKALSISRSDFRSPAFVILIATLASIFFNPEMWWARYVPQFWIVPFLVFFITADRGRSNFANSMILALISVTVLISVIARIKQSIHDYSAYSDAIHALKNRNVVMRYDNAMASNFLPTLIWRAQKHNIKIVGSKEDCKTTSGLFLLRVCVPE